MPTVKSATPLCGGPACVRSNEAAVGLRKQAKHEFRNVACAFSKSADKAAAQLGESKRHAARRDPAFLPLTRRGITRGAFIIFCPQQAM